MMGSKHEHMCHMRIRIGLGIRIGFYQPILVLNCYICVKCIFLNRCSQFINLVKTLCEVMYCTNCG